MDEMAARLASCFAAIFPGLMWQQISRPNVELLSAWDSLTTVRLWAVLQEEFGVEIRPDEMEQLTSFTAIYDYLLRHSVAASRTE